MDSLPPHSPEAERGVLGCCLIDIAKAALAVKAGVTPRWFYDARHAEIFGVLTDMAASGVGDPLIAGLRLRDRGKLDAVGGFPYLGELQSAVPSAENFDYYLPELRDRFQRRQVIDAATRLRMLASEESIDSAVVLADTKSLLERLHRQAGGHALPEIVPATALLETEMVPPAELVLGVLHAGNKLILGGASKSYKTWSLIDLAVSVATGSPWLGFPTRPGKVLYVNLEIQTAFFRQRIAQVVEAKGVDPPERLEVWNLRGWAADYRVLVPKIQERIRDEHYAMVILDPTYKLLGTADENSATDISALLNTIEALAVGTGAAVAMAGHFAKGNASSKETIDRISGSGVFARDPDSLIIFTRHEEEGAFTVEMVLRNLPPVPSFVVQWEHPCFRANAELDPSRLKSKVGRPRKHTAESLLAVLGDQRLTSGQWKKLAMTEEGVTHARFFELLKELQKGQKVLKSVIDGKWEQTRRQSQYSNHENEPF